MSGRSAPNPQPTSREAQIKDQKLLKWLLLRLCEVPDNDPPLSDPSKNIVAGTQYDDDPIVKALTLRKCSRFLRDLLTMSGQEILNLQEEVTDTNGDKTLRRIPIYKARMLHLSLIHI